MAMEQLSQRENEVFELAARGLSNDEIAEQLNISRRTVETHLRTVFHKTGVSRRSQLVALARDGVLPPAGGERTTRASPPAQPAVPPGTAERRLELYEAALRRLVDRQFPLFEERVELTVTVGDREGRDTVVERRRTVPKPYLIHRAMRPIMTPAGGVPMDLTGLDLRCDVYGQDIRADLSTMLEQDGRPLVMVLFQPGLQTPTEWTLGYSSPRLWNPLRETGVDTLNWATATFDERHRPTVDELTLTVIFPAGWTGVGIGERDGLGTVRTTRLPTGQTQVTWHDRMSIAGAYHWELRGGIGSEEYAG